MKKEKQKRLVTIVKGNGSPLRSKKVGRNQLCACGSGKKTKKCCGNQAVYLHTKQITNNKTEE